MLGYCFAVFIGFKKALVYAKFQRFDRCYRWAGSCSNKDTTLPYDIRAEIDWHDFACTANPLGAPERIKDAIASAIAEAR